MKITYPDSCNMPGVKTSNTNSVPGRKLQHYTMIMTEQAIPICHIAYFHCTETRVFFCMACLYQSLRLYYSFTASTREKFRFVMNKYRHWIWTWSPPHTFTIHPHKINKYRHWIWNWASLVLAPHSRSIPIRLVNTATGYELEPAKSSPHIHNPSP